MASSTPSSPSSDKKSRLEINEGDAAAPADAAGHVSNTNGSSNPPGPVGSNGALPAKNHTPAQAEHLRFGHVDYEEVEESEEDKRRHYLLRKPKVKQWFYKGKLFRSAEGRASARIEL